MFNKKVITVIALLFLIVGSFVCGPNKAFSYSSTPTHPNLTKEMIRLYNMYYDPDVTDEKVKQIIQGSIDEDMAPRWSFHLYDPIYNRAPFGVATAKEWGASSNIQGDAIHKFANALLNIFGTTKFSYHGNFSWIANVKNYTNNKTEKSWYGLGHTLHLIADMTVPAHSRNDHHILGEPFEAWSGNLKPEDYIFADELFEKRKLPIEIYNIEQAFDSLARYSNKYFFSKDSISRTSLGDQYSNPIIIDNKEYDFGKYITKFYAIGKDENGESFKLAQVDAMESNWRNYNPDATKNNVYVINERDIALQQDYWSRLAPKAVEYGAAVIKLFLDEAEDERAKIAQQDKKSWFAQIFNPEDGLDQEEESNYTPPPQLTVLPSKLPESQDAIAPSTQTPDFIPELTDPMPSEQPSVTTENNQKQEQNEEQEPQNNNQEETQNESTIVAGPKTGDSGGTAPGSIHQEQSINNNDQENNLEEEDKASASHLIINEIQTRDNEFVELYNPTDSAIDLSGYYFSYYSSARDWNNPWRNQEFPASASIPANGYYLIGLQGFPQTEGNPDADWQVYNSDQLNNSNGSVAIFPSNPDSDTKTPQEIKDEAVDAVAWGCVDFVKETTEFNQTLGIDKSMQRKLNADTDNNDSDFEFRKMPSPTNSKGETHKGGTTINDHTTISQNTTWTIYNSPYYLESNAGQWPIVEEGKTLTIEPGVIIMPKNPYYTFLEIKGTLKAEGTSDEKIVFTSEKDADYGGAGGADKGDMKNIVFSSTSKNSVLDYVLFRYGGRPDINFSRTEETIKIDNSSVEIKNSTIEKSYGVGIKLINSNSEIKNSILNDNWTGIYIDGTDSSEIESSEFKDNFYHGIEISNNAKSKIENNIFNNGSNYAIYTKSAGVKFSGNNIINNPINGVCVSDSTIVSEDTRWDADLPYVIESNAGSYFTISEGATLTLGSGVIIKPASQYYNFMVVEGTLTAVGETGNEIIFTSLKDDSFGGDTNNDNDESAPQTGDWKQIEFKSTSTGSVLDYVKMYYGTGDPPITEETSGSVEIKDTVETKNP